MWLLAVSLLVSACAGTEGSDDRRTTTEPRSDGTSPNEDIAAEVGTTVRPAGQRWPPLPTCWAARAPTGEARIEFDNVTDEWGLVSPLTGMYGHATAVADVNGDGWADLFVSGFADRPTENYQVRGATGPTPDSLLLGGPDGFEGDASFEGELGRTSGATFADLDADSDLDLVVIRNPRGDDDVGSRASAIYERTEDGWDLATLFAGNVAGRSVATIDVDRDGLVDLALAGDRFGAGPSRLYRNNGNLEFSDATSLWGMPGDMTGLALATVDLNDDGWLDLLVSGDTRVLMGGESGFSTSSQPVLQWELFGEEDDPAGISVGDLDADGRPDLVVGHHFNSTIDEGRKVPIRVFLNRSENGQLGLIEATDDVGVVGLTTKSPHVSIADLDNDGHADIVTSAAAENGSPIVFRNSGADPLAFEVVGEPGDGTYWVTGATEDFDRDGRLDAFLLAWEPESESPMFRSVGNGGHWLEIDVGALGPALPEARVEVRAEANADGELLGAGWGQSTSGYAAGVSSVVRVGLGTFDEEQVELRITARDESIVATGFVDSRMAIEGC